MTQEADADEPPFDWAKVADVDVDVHEELEPEHEVLYPLQELPPELDEVPPLNKEQEQEVPPLPWPDQVAVANSFASWRNEEAYRQVRFGFEAMNNVADTAIIHASVESVERDACFRAFMAAERGCTSSSTPMRRQPSSSSSSPSWRG